MNDLEHKEQCALIQWAELAAKEEPALKLLFAIPNGGYRNLLTAIKLKKEGVKPGVPDLFLAYPTLEFSGMFIEMKSKKGVVSEKQKEWMARLKKSGYEVKICYGFDEAKEAIEDYLYG